MTNDDIPLDAARIERAARCLGRRERAVLVLSAAEGLELRAVAERLGLHPAEAERLLADALIKLDAALRREDQVWWRFW
ncbi:MAG TPA: sigma factor-like helix-turn-helix DNA-binding protein [Allosphingosinicella sp.]|nr:sigma factor-like helix-turn-helix DNA-binding protein [Allosphingosinicella sp.]